MSDARTVALIGLGRMGGAMARTLHRDGHPLVLWNRHRPKAEAVATDTGAPIAATPAEAAGGAGVVITSLADDAAMLDVYLGDHGVVDGLRAGSLAVDTSTVDPSTATRVGEAVEAVGAGFLDAPVSGSVSTVEAGALTFMVGGDATDLERARPILETLAARIVHTGPRGSGAVTKLAVNGLVHGLNIALSEALVLAEKAGVERSVAYEVFAGGAGGAPFVQYKREAYEHPDTAQVAFTLDLVEKDLALITGLGRRVGAPMAQAETGLDIVRNAIEAGMGDRDLSAVAVYLRESA
jgi:3-hydroxyisobutyrate dehydrogenase-like beta-hydroxyacid dehydrogenase